MLTHRTVGPLHASTSPQIPLVGLTHLGATLDSWDPGLVDELAEDRPVVLLGYRGVGGSSGRVQRTVTAMADDVITAVAALGYGRVDLLGLSMGGMVALAVLNKAPDLVGRAALSASGPPGGSGLSRIRRAMLRGAAQALVLRTDPRAVLFFTRTPVGREAARQYLARLGGRTAERERAVTGVVIVAQSAAVRDWGCLASSHRSPFTGPVWIVQGDSDRIVSPTNAGALAAVLPQARVSIFPDSGHGVAFQHHRDVAEQAREFFRR